MASTQIRLLAGFLFLLALLFFVSAGIAIAVFVNSTTEVVYESQAVFQIAPKWIAGNGVSDTKVDKLVELCDLPHGQLLSSHANVESCLTENNLFPLDSFFDLSNEQCVDQTLGNLEVFQIREDAKIYKVVMHSSNPLDCATIVNNLVNHYYKKLVLDAPDMRSHFAFKMLEGARIGNQISPVLPINLSIGVGAAVLLAATLWFFLNPFKFKYPFSVAELIVVLTLTSLFITAGMAIVRWLDGSAEYVSTSRILIQDKAIESSTPRSAKEKRLLDLSRIPHHVLFKQYNQIEQGLEKNNLYVLDIFMDLAKEEANCHVQENLDIVPDLNVPHGFKISFHASNPDECKRVLEKLIATYLDSLDEQYEEIQHNNLKLNSAAAENGTATPEFGMPHQYQTKLLTPASDAVPVLKRQSSRVASLFAGYAAGLLILVAWLVWRATRDLGNKKQFSTT